MPDVHTALAANRDAVNELLAAAEASTAAWTTPRAPGKWSPCQIVEHVARTLEESAHVVAGSPSKFPTLPAFIRPLVRLIFNRVLKKGAFPKARASKAFNPIDGPATPAAGRVRLEAALAEFEKASRARAAAGLKVSHPGFGPVSVEDYARFQELHTRHHCKQMPSAAHSREAGL